MLILCLHYEVLFCFCLMCTSYLCRSARLRRCWARLSLLCGARRLRFRCSNPISGSWLKMALKRAHGGILVASLFCGLRRCVGACWCAGLCQEERCLTEGSLSSPGMRSGWLDARILGCRRCRAHVTILRLLIFVIFLVPRHRKQVYRRLYLHHKDKFAASSSLAPRCLQLPPCLGFQHFETDRYEYYVLLLVIGCSPLLSLRLRKC